MKFSPLHWRWLAVSSRLFFGLRSGVGDGRPRGRNHASDCRGQSPAAICLNNDMAMVIFAPTTSALRMFATDHRPGAPGRCFDRDFDQRQSDNLLHAFHTARKMKLVTSALRAATAAG